MPIISLEHHLQTDLYKAYRLCSLRGSNVNLYVFWFGGTDWVYHKLWLGVPWDLEWKNDCIKFNMQFKMFKWQADVVPYKHALMPTLHTVLRNGIGV